MHGSRGKDERRHVLNREAQHRHAPVLHSPPLLFSVDIGGHSRATPAQDEVTRSGIACRKCGTTESLAVDARVLAPICCDDKRQSGRGAALAREGKRKG